MDNGPFILDHAPEVGTPERLAPGLRRITAPNAGPMTFRGTNTYLLGEEEIAVIDPGPEDAAHLAAILAATGGGRRISHIIVTHSHVDHSPLAQRLGREADAPVLAFGHSAAGRSARLEALAASGDLGGGEGVDAGFAPDLVLAEGQVIASRDWGLGVLHTPGHFGNHVCLAWEAEGALFSGDHVMSWATTLVSPPDGDLGAFMASLERLVERPGDRRYYPGHGAVLEEPRVMLDHQLAHRRQREAQIRAALEDGPATPAELARRIYTDIDPRLIPAATRNVFAHLIDLSERNLATPAGPLSATSRFETGQG